MALGFDKPLSREQQIEHRHPPFIEGAEARDHETNGMKA
jgi:hypothetical protein